MPYRDLPNTDATRSAALRTLFEKSVGVADADLPYPAALRGQINTLYPQWTTEVGEVATALGAQTGLTETAEMAAAEFDLVFNHFVQVLHLAVRRGVYERSDRTFYGLHMDQSDVPPTTNHAARVLWAGRIAAGEAARAAANPGQPAMSNPSAAQVAAAFAAYSTAQGTQSDAKEAYDEEQEDVQGLRPTANALILEVWDQMEFKYRRESGPSRRRKCREWGVVYIPRAGEAPDPDDGGDEGGGGGGGGDTGPGTPVLSSTIDSGTITLTMTAANATLFNVYEQAPGESEFSLEASAVASGWTKDVSAGSGEWLYQVAGLAADGVTEGPRSATTSQGA